MTSERKFRDEKHVRYSGAPDIRRADGRYTRWSWRYKAFQSYDKEARTWRNITPEMARSYMAAGLPMGCHGGDAGVP